MSDQIEEFTEDSAGATEVDHEAQEAIESEAKSEDTESVQGDLPEEVYYEIDGEEVSAEDVKKWKAGHLMQSDYTKKTQALSEEKKAFEASKTSLEEKFEMLSSLEADIENMALGDLKNVDLDKILAEEGTEEYLRVQREIEKRKASVKGLSEKFSAAQNKYFEEAYKQLSDSLGWSDESKRVQDISSIEKYVKDSGITEAEFSKVTNPKIMAALVEASKYRELMKRKDEVSKKVVKAPKVTKPSAPARSNKPLSLAERMYGKKS